VYLLTEPLNIFTFFNNLWSGFVQNRNFGGFPFGEGAQNEGVGIILRNGVVSEVDAVVG